MPVRRPAFRSSPSNLSLGEIQTLPERSKDMPCAPASCPSGAVCCAPCQFRFGLISAAGHVLRLDRWREAPAFEKDCDPRAAPWMQSLVIAVSGFLTDDATAAEDAQPTLNVDRTCRIE